MIGKVTTPDGKTIVLNDRGDIECEDPDLKEWVELGLEIHDSRSGGPSGGAWGVSFLNKIAQILRGKAEFAPRPKMPPGTIY